MKLLVVLLLLPFVELYLLFKLAHWAGAGWTLALVIATAVMGVAIARRQSWELARRMEVELEQDELPTSMLVDAAMIRVAGTLLVLPGILTDLVGFSLLIPPVRRVYRAALLQWFQRYSSVLFGRTFIRVHDHEDQNTIDAEVVSRSVEAGSELCDLRTARERVDASQDERG